MTCLAISSKITNFVPADDLELKRDTVNNLMSDSIIKMHHICSFDKKRVTKYIGKASNKTMEEITIRLKQQFNL